VDDDVARIRQFRQQWCVLNRVDRIVKARVRLEVGDVLDASRRQVVDDRNLVATAQIVVG